jgi:hypothetical protein
MADLQGEPDFDADRGLFRAEYERELGTWLRRRLGYLCLAYAVFQLLSVTMLTLASTVFLPEFDEAIVSPELTRRIEAAERRVESGRMREPRDAAALAARDAETRRLERERGRDAVVSTLDAFGKIAQDLTRGGGGNRLFSPAPPPKQLERPIEPRWLRGTDSAVVRREDSPIPLRDTFDGAAAERSGGVEDDVASGTRNETANVPRASESRGTDPIRTERWTLPGSPALRTSTITAGDAPDAILRLPWWVWILAACPMFAVLGWFGLRVRPKLHTRSELVAAATRMILALGLLNFGFECVLLLANPEAPVTPLLSIFFWHLTASLFLPWNWRESLKPIIPVLACWFLLRLGLVASDGAWGGFLATVIFAPLLFAPALILCYARLRWHQRRFKSGFVGRRFLAMRREFIQARAVHESLFPKPEDFGWLRFDFSYRPAADIGGDFIHSWIDDSDRFNVALIDVTGHGLASAMTVARIHGEIERLRDEHPDDGPARMLARLNRYFQRLLSRHRLFATAVLISIDPRTGEVRYANAGHPPVFIRSRNGVRELESTTFLLGAVDNTMFGEEEVSFYLEEGDRLLLFTDGAYDAKSPRGDRFGMDRLRDIVRRPTAPPHWPKYLMNLVETFEAGMPEDDLLIAEICLVQRRSISGITGDDLPISRAEMLGAPA